jgi:hypothetical protein
LSELACSGVAGQLTSGDRRAYAVVELQVLYASRRYSGAYLTTLTDLFDHWKKAHTRPCTIDTYYCAYVQDFEAVHGAVPVVAVFAFRLARQGLARESVRS